MSYITGGVVFTRASIAAVETASLGMRFIGIGMSAVGCIVGVGIGGYLTHTYCEQILEQFKNFYKNNSEL